MHTISGVSVYNNSYKPILSIAWSVFPNLSIVQSFKYLLAISTNSSSCSKTPNTILLTKSFLTSNNSLITSLVSYLILLDL